MTKETPSYRVLNPATGELIESFPTATDADVQGALQRADAAFREWRERPVEDRAAIVAKAGALFAERADMLGEIIALEMGKFKSAGAGEAAFCQSIFDYYAKEGPKLLAPRPVDSFNGGSAMIEKLPVGVILGIMPWNYPYYQVARFVAPNLVVGNTIILKHSELCPRSALAVQDILRDAGVPEGVYNNLFASHDQIETIIADPRVQGISLTGSERAGAAVGELAGRYLKKVVLELGGSDPYVVLDSADVTRQAADAWKTRMSNAGQACNSNKRMIVMDEIFDDFVSELARQAQALAPGDPLKEEAGTFAPLSTRAAAEALDAQVRDAVEKGAVVHAGGKLSDGPGAYYQPTVLTGVTPAMRAFKEELFGPVAVVYKVSSDEEALQIANDSPYGLGGAVFSANPDRARRVARQLEVGMANVNLAAGEGADLPFGGIKRSGFGRELGPLGISEFVNHRLFCLAE